VVGIADKSSMPLTRATGHEFKCRVALSPQSIKDFSAFDELVRYVAVLLKLRGDGGYVIIRLRSSLGRARDAAAARRAGSLLQRSQARRGGWARLSGERGPTG